MLRVCPPDILGRSCQSAFIWHKCEELWVTFNIGEMGWSWAARGRPAAQYGQSGNCCAIFPVIARFAPPVFTARGMHWTWVPFCIALQFKLHDIEGTILKWIEIGPTWCQQRITLSGCSKQMGKWGQLLSVGFLRTLILGPLLFASYVNACAWLSHS